MIIIAEKVIFLPQFVGRLVLGGCAAVRGHHLGGDAVIRQLRCGYSAAAPRLIRHHLVVMRLFAAVTAMVNNLKG